MSVIEKAEKLKTGTPQTPSPAPTPAPIPITTRDEAEASAGLVVGYMLELVAQQNERNIKLLAAQKYDANITRLEEKMAVESARLEQWATANRASLFGDRQTLELRQATLTFQRGKRALSLLDGWTWQQVQDALTGKGWAGAVEKLLKRGWRRFLRLKVEVDKTAILKEADPDRAAISEKQLSKRGLQVTQQERFSVEPRLEPFPCP
jgi:phage host-nuclease inhibitor protein Gam